VRVGSLCLSLCDTRAASGFDPPLKQDGVLFSGGYVALQSESSASPRYPERF